MTYASGIPHVVVVTLAEESTARQPPTLALVALEPLANHAPHVRDSGHLGVTQPAPENPLAADV
jgi:hypothetical protein